MNELLNAQGDAPNTLELQRLRAAVAALLQKKPDVRKKQVRALCETWGVHRRDGGQMHSHDRPLATVIAELQQAVLVKGTQLRARDSGAQTGCSAAA